METKYWIVIALVIVLAFVMYNKKENIFGAGNSPKGLSPLNNWKCSDNNPCRRGYCEKEDPRFIGQCCVGSYCDSDIVNQKMPKNWQGCNHNVPCGTIKTKNGYEKGACFNGSCFWSEMPKPIYD